MVFLYIKYKFKFTNKPHYTFHENITDNKFAAYHHAGLFAEHKGDLYI